MNYLTARARQTEYPVWKLPVSVAHDLPLRIQAQIYAAMGVKPANPATGDKVYALLTHLFNTAYNKGLEAGHKIQQL